MSARKDEAPAVVQQGLLGGAEQELPVTASDATLAQWDEACREQRDRRDKLFQNWRARFAMAGWALYITTTDGRASFVVTRWGHVREFASLTAVEAFAAQIGVKA